MKRRPLLLAASSLALPRLGRAQPAWPSRPVTILVPYVAGGPSDTLARATAAALQPAIGQPVVVENRPGANGAVAAGLTARAAPDGHTLFIAASGILTINPHLMPNLPYDPMRDFAPLTIAISAPNLLVANPRFPPHDLPGLVAWLRANPNRASYGTSGIGSSEHLTMELFAQRTGTRLTHVPYGGGAAAVTDLIAGTTELSFLNVSTVAPHVQSGALRALAVSSLARHPLFPDVPTVDESGVPGFEGGSWHSFVAPRATPEPLLEALHAALVAALRQPETEARLTRIGFSVTATSRAAFAARMEREYGEWREVIRTAGIAPG
ncbi:tripartite tricarboxylate transporter substrate binding protein [Belnapia sp. T6]|uniref:Tripartite tricarboxylate transporter substrate binding protein n=1 Tax=Belnapia mucosa TaxID=2804532 RepID=A0ABS1V158_9PROT|nr:tripartite tricarboxylate transporter substrate-binding protein [Belnapia mucosa]MBL6455440.1 tripartite tricarboxylate transporter substrate binding protein [Belnapia mucosa]